MISEADRWLADEGPRGVIRQPLSGVPFKVFARLAGGRDLPIGAFLSWALAARGTRFVAATLPTALLGWRYGWLRRRVLIVSVLWGLVFGVGLWRTVLSWEHATGRAVD